MKAMDERNIIEPGEAHAALNVVKITILSPTEAFFTSKIVEKSIKTKTKLIL
jgi:hypothetical protein